MVRVDRNMVRANGNMVRANKKNEKEALSVARYHRVLSKEKVNNLGKPYTIRYT